MTRAAMLLVPALVAALAGAAAGPAVRAAELIVHGDGDGTLVVDTWTCRQLGADVAYRPEPGVEYQPGVDARGRPVAPADIGGGYAIDLPEQITIPITVDLLGPWRDNTGAGVVKGEALMGVVTIRDGTAYWNGEPMEPAAQRQIRDACRLLAAQRAAAGERKPGR